MGPASPLRGTFDGGPLQGTWEYRYARQRGGTHLAYEMDYELRGMLRLAGGLLRGQYADGIRQGMSMLKRHVEETTGTAPGPPSLPGRSCMAGQSASSAGGSAPRTASVEARFALRPRQTPGS